LGSSFDVFAAETARPGRTYTLCVIQTPSVPVKHPLTWYTINEDENDTEEEMASLRNVNKK